MFAFDEKYGIFLPWTVVLNDTLVYQVDDKKAWNRFLKNNQIGSESVDPQSPRLPRNMIKRAAFAVKNKIRREKPGEFEKHRIKEISGFRRRFFQNLEEGSVLGQIQPDIQLLETGNEIPTAENTVVSVSEVLPVMNLMLSRTTSRGPMTILIREKEFWVEIKKDRIIQICDVMKEFGERIDFLWGITTVRLYLEQ